MWPDRLAYFGRQVASRKANLLSYIVLLRVTPVLPNTFINVASPMVDVPLPPFMLGTPFFDLALQPCCFGHALCALHCLTILSISVIDPYC